MRLTLHAMKLDDSLVCSVVVLLKTTVGVNVVVFCGAAEIWTSRSKAMGAHWPLLLIMSIAHPPSNMDAFCLVLAFCQA